MDVVIKPTRFRGVSLGNGDILHTTAKGGVQVAWIERASGYREELRVREMPDHILIEGRHHGLGAVSGDNLQRDLEAFIATHPDPTD